MYFKSVLFNTSPFLSKKVLISPRSRVWTWFNKFLWAMSILLLYTVMISIKKDLKLFFGVRGLGSEKVEEDVKVQPHSDPSKFSLRYLIININNKICNFSCKKLNINKHIYYILNILATEINVNLYQEYKPQLATEIRVNYVFFMKEVEFSA